MFLAVALFLQLLGLFLHGGESCCQSTLFLWVILILLIAGLEDGQQLLVVSGLAEYEHDDAGEEKGDEVVEV